MNAPDQNRLRCVATLFATLVLAPAFGARAQSAPPAPVHAAAVQHRPPAAPSVEGVLNLNSATLDELTRLPGVGPARAQAILELRTKLSGFKKLDDLMRVKGIGRKTFRKLEPMLRLDGKTTLVTLSHAHGAQQ